MMLRLAISLPLWLWATTACAVGPIGYEIIVQATIRDHILGRYDRLRTATGDLASVTARACDDGQGLASRDVRAAFRQAAMVWAGAQHLRWGPARKDYRYERMSFGSDPKNYVGRQLRRLVAKADPAVLDLEKFRVKSVAIQGLTALERLIHTSPKRGTSKAYRCALGATIARNVAAIARVMAIEWRDPRGHTALMTKPGPENPLYKDAREAAMGAFKPLAGGLRFMLDIKIKDPLQASAQRARPRYVEFWRSGAATAVLTANLEALRDLYIAGGFAAETAARAGELDARIRDDFREALAILAAIQMPIARAVKEPSGRADLGRLIAVLERLWKEIAFGVAGTLELSVGFNEFDGD